MYSSRPIQPADFNEKAFQVVDNKGTFIIPIVGPRHPRGGQDLSAAARATVSGDSGTMRLSLDDTSVSIILEPGKWSDWLKVSFKSGVLQSVRGMLRFYLKSLEPDFELYASPVNFDPQEPLFPISSPASYAAELENRLGTFYTIGMAEDHDGLINSRFDERGGY